MCAGLRCKLLSSHLHTLATPFTSLTSPHHLPPLPTPQRLFLVLDNTLRAYHLMRDGAAKNLNTPEAAVLPRKVGPGGRWAGGRDQGSLSEGIGIGIKRTTVYKRGGGTGRAGCQQMPIAMAHLTPPPYPPITIFTYRPRTLPPAPTTSPPPRSVS